MKRLVIPFIAASMLLASCGEPAEQQTADSVSETTEHTTVNTTESTTEASTEATTDKETESEISETSKPENAGALVLYDDNDIKITHKRTGEMSNCLAIEVEIENNTDQDLVIQTKDFNVNDYMTRAAFSADVLAGKKAVQSIRILDEELQKNGMERADIQKVEFRFTFNTPKFEDVFEDSDIITLKYSK